MGCCTYGWGATQQTSKMCLLDVIIKECSGRDQAGRRERMTRVHMCDGDRPWQESRRTGGAEPAGIAVTMRSGAPPAKGKKRGAPKWRRDARDVGVPGRYRSHEYYAASIPKVTESRLVHSGRSCAGTRLGKWAEPR